MSYFVFDVLPHLEGKKVILLTSQYFQPYLGNSSVTQEILNSDVIFFGHLIIIFLTIGSVLIFLMEFSRIRLIFTTNF